MATGVWGNVSNEDSKCSDDSDQNSFEDDFSPITTAKLPDSQEYLASLEGKLRRLQGQKDKKDLVKSLELARESCMLRLLQDNTATATIENQSELDSPIEVSEILRRVAPEQALTAGELVELLKADELAKALA